MTLSGQDYIVTGELHGIRSGKVRAPSALVPFGGSLSSSTTVVVLGHGFADYNAHCQIGSSGRSCVPQCSTRAHCYALCRAHAGRAGIG